MINYTAVMVWNEAKMLREYSYRGPDIGTPPMISTPRITIDLHELRQGLVL